MHFTPLPHCIFLLAGEKCNVWSFNYFFYNKSLKRIVYFAARATSKVSGASEVRPPACRMAYPIVFHVVLRDIKAEPQMKGYGTTEVAVMLVSRSCAAAPCAQLCQFRQSCTTHAFHRTRNLRVAFLLLVCRVRSPR